MGPRVAPTLVPTADRGDAVRAADVIITVTTSVTTRLLEPEWLRPGVTVVVLDNGGKETGILRVVDRVFVDDRRPFGDAEVLARFHDRGPAHRRGDRRDSARASGRTFERGPTYLDPESRDRRLRHRPGRAGVRTRVVARPWDTCGHREAHRRSSARDEWSFRVPRARPIIVGSALRPMASPSSRKTRRCEGGRSNDRLPRKASMPFSDASLSCSKSS